MSQHARENPEMYERSSDARAFSADQQNIIAKTEAGIAREQWEEQIFDEIASNYYGQDGFTNGVNLWLVDPAKLATFLAKHIHHHE